MRPFLAALALGTAFTALFGVQVAEAQTSAPSPRPSQKPAVAAAKPLKTKPGYSVVDLMPDFRKFWAQARDKDQATQVALFKKLVADPHPEVYNRDVLGGPPDKAFAATLPERYPAIQALVQPKMDLVLRLSQQIGQDLPRYENSFRKTFPDLKYNGRIYFMYSLGAFDGATRTVRDKEALLFGLDMIAYVYGQEADPEPFFHHELFHIYHSQFFGEEQTVAAALWREGLATYVAHALNPKAAGVNLFGLPRNTPERTQAALPRYVGPLRAVLNSEKKEDYSRYFMGMDEQAETPARSGYYIGYLVAEKLAKRHSLQELAHAQLKDLLPEIEQALQELEAQPLKN
ncbi:hypothetical protein I2I05_06295 [Hymenobacter sp. BT683]|uniref:DUF2268 domain-containing protein n=1 Tax=Hymenobacter jeongseonensis TaxID=2791027 RepID=A0ABS0IF67_9BACT|nr:DUF2268 domain-containing putative Zn-dependent protease [Hymenobacter jeongseonensis]MBF9237001.1 hypothetical protein [Hymenobacter jeongseonensis]